MKAVIYARYSSDSQREESIEGQLRECTAFAEKNGITILRHYIDRAYSAKTDNRPECTKPLRGGLRESSAVRIFVGFCSSHTVVDFSFQAFFTMKLPIPLSFTS